MMNTSGPDNQGSNGRDLRNDPRLSDTLSAAPRSTVPLARWGHLDVRAKLGAGGFGEVYRAYDATLDREVALKLLHQNSRLDDDRFLEEGRRLALFRHANVLPVLGADRHDDRAGIWTDLIEGLTLEELLTAQGALGAPEATLIGLELCKALAAIHAEGLIHRDIKASNVMREKGGRIVLMDFGCVSPSAEPGSEDRNTQVEGTPLYMAPEQMAGVQPEPRHDIYSVGVLLYRLVTNSYPVDAPSYRELYEHHQRGARVPLRDARADLPSTFVRVVDKAMHPDPQQRFQSAGALEAALQQCAGVEARTVATPTPEQPRSSFVRNALLLALVLALAGVIWMLRPTPEFTLEAAFFKDHVEGEMRLHEMAEIAVGDKVYMEVESTEEFYLYVLNEDDLGSAYLLFPDANLEDQNPLPAGRHTVPGKATGGGTYRWEADEAGGVERFLILASLEPIDEIEADILNFQSPELMETEEPVALSEGSKVKLRGFGIRTRVDAKPGGASKLSDIIDELPVESFRSKDGVVFRTFRLRNPKRED